MGNLSRNCFEKNNSALCVVPRFPRTGWVRTLVNEGCSSRSEVHEVFSRKQGQMRQEWSSEVVFLSCSELFFFHLVG